MNPDTLQGIAFDWGDTLMQLFPQYSGAMVDWPQVAAVAGAAEALSILHGRYRLFVATNAVDSSPAQVQAALDRVGLGRYIEKVFTYQVLDSRKPSPDYFSRLADMAAIPAARMLMVGDSYTDDILGAKQAGWSAIWLNPAHQAACALLPLQDADLHQFARLPLLLTQPLPPDYATCMNLLLQNGASHSLLQHVHTTAASAYQLALWIQAGGGDVDPILAQRGGLLHDVGKLRALRTAEGPNHGQLGAIILERAGYPALAQIAVRHMLFSILEGPGGPETWEQKLVYFADKLAEGARLVTVEERIAALKSRYHLDASRLEAAVLRITALENEISHAVGQPPAEWMDRLRQKMANNGE